jgi:hypothetical protein
MGLHCRSQGRAGWCRRACSPGWDGGVADRTRVIPMLLRPLAKVAACP